jgi:PHD/YefM family antitoxin component YafN of YafNO toxin-antitoxin module
MQTAEKIHPQYIMDDTGRQTAVIIPIKEFNQLMEDIEDLTAAAERINEPTILHENLVADLKKDGYLSD